jgi:hypothetical protein
MILFPIHFTKDTQTDTVNFIMPNINPIKYISLRFPVKQLIILVELMDFNEVHITARKRVKLHSLR